MKQKMSISERASKALLESREGLIEDAKLRGYNPSFLSPKMLSSLEWYKNITKMTVSFVIVFILSPKGLFLDLKESRIKDFFVKAFILFCFSIPFTVVFFLFCLLMLVGVVTLISALVSVVFT